MDFMKGVVKVGLRCELLSIAFYSGHEEVLERSIIKAEDTLSNRAIVGAVLGHSMDYVFDSRPRAVEFSVVELLVGDVHALFELVHAWAGGAAA